MLMGCGTIPMPCCGHNSFAAKHASIEAQASDLTGFDAGVRRLDSWEEFEAVMGSSRSTMEQCQEAANNLATEFDPIEIYISGCCNRSGKAAAAHAVKGNTAAPGKV